MVAAAMTAKEKIISAELVGGPCDGQRVECVECHVIVLQIKSNNRWKDVHYYDVGRINQNHDRIYMYDPNDCDVELVDER